MSIASTLPNTAKITDQMAGMPDAALQQMAQMYKQDPYVLPLIVSESQRRQMLRAQAQAQNSMQMGQPPKVVDQAIAAMAPAAQPAPPMPGRPMPSMAQMQQQLPENQGIATLPAAQQMEYAAEGGIMGYASAGLVDVEEVPGPPAQFIRSGVMGRRINPAYVAWEQNYGEKWRTQRKEAMKTAPLTAEQKQTLAPGLMSNLINQTALAGEVSANAPAVSDAYPDEISSGRMAYQDTGAAARSFNDIVDPAQKPPAAQTPTGIAQLTAPTAAVPANVGPVDYAGSAEGLKKAGILQPSKDEDWAKETKAQEDVAKTNLGLAQQGQHRIKQFDEALGEYGAGREKRLKEREEKLGKDEKANYGLAFLEAGLAMMGGKDPNAFANISAGALKGLTSYKTGLAKLDDRKEKLFDAYDALEDARRSDAKDRFVRIEAAQLRVDNAETALAKVGADIAVKKGDFDRSQATAFGTATVSAATAMHNAKIRAAEGEADRKTRVAIAKHDADVRQAIAAGPGDLQKLYTALGGGDLQKGFETAKKLEAVSKKDLMSEYTDWLKANPTLAMDSDKAVSEFLRQYMVMSNMTRTVTPSKGAPVLKQP